VQRQADVEALGQLGGTGEQFVAGEVVPDEGHHPSTRLPAATP